MSSLIALLLCGLIFPSLWGLLVHRVLKVLWPVERRRAVWWSEDGANGCVPEFLDYQI